MSYLKEDWGKVVRSPNVHRYVSTGIKGEPRLVNENDSSSNQIPETQNNNNSFENASEKCVHSGKISEDVKKDTHVFIHKDIVKFSAGGNNQNDTSNAYFDTAITARSTYMTVTPPKPK